MKAEGDSIVIKQTEVNWRVEIKVRASGKDEIVDESKGGKGREVGCGNREKVEKDYNEKVQEKETRKVEREILMRKLNEKGRLGKQSQKIMNESRKKIVRNWSQEMERERKEKKYRRKWRDKV